VISDRSDADVPSVMSDPAGSRGEGRTESRHASMPPPVTAKEMEETHGHFARLPWRLVCLFLVFLAIDVLLYFPGLGSEMIYDSKAGIADKVQVFASRDLMDILSMVPGRPVFMLSLYVNFLMTGMDPWFFRFTDLAILAATGVVIVLLTTALLGTPPMVNQGTERDKRIVALVLGLLFVIHPLQSFVVLYIWQRQALLACFFCFAALAVYVTARSGRFRAPALGYTATGILFLAALLTKESAISLPSMLILAEIVFFRSDPRQIARRMLTLGLICVPALFAYVLVNHALQGPATVHTRGVLNLLLDNYRMAQLTLPEVAATQCRVLCTYLRMIVAPSFGHLPLVKAEIISRSLWDPPDTAAAVAAVIALLSLGIGLARVRPLAAFGFLFFVITAIPEAMLSPQYLFFGYRPVLFMVGLLLALGDVVGLFLSGGQGKALRKVTAIVVSAWAAYLAAVTMDQARHWSPLVFWQTAFSRLPALSEHTEKKSYEDILINFGDQLIRKGQYGEAVNVLEKAVRINPWWELAHTKLAVALEKNGATREAITSYRKAVASSPRSSAVRVSLGEALLRAGNTAEGIEVLKAAVALNPHEESARVRLGMALVQAGSAKDGVRDLRTAVAAHPSSASAHLNLGIALKATGKAAEAIAQYRRALELDPRLTIAYTALGLALEGQGDVGGAQESLRKALALEPRSADLYYNLANCLMKGGNLGESIANFRRALELRPDFPEAEANFGTVLLRSGRIADAVVYLKKALAHMPDNGELHNALGAALAEQGRAAEAVKHFKKALEIDPGHAAARQNLENVSRQKGR
jgi:protein O-mannosyl-transferase